MFKVFFYTCLPLRAKIFVVSLSLFGSSLCKDKRKREKKKNHFILPSANCLM